MNPIKMRFTENSPKAKHYDNYDFINIYQEKPTGTCTGGKYHRKDASLSGTGLLLACTMVRGESIIEGKTDTDREG